MWIYTPDRNNTVRYTLGEPGSNNLVCIGVNPSTAEPDKLDPTLRVVKKLSKKFGYDGWIMINIYPQRATKSSNLHKELDEDIHTKNILHIEEIAQKYNIAVIWAAWGTLIKKRKYLKDCLIDIVNVLPGKDWISVGPNSVDGHPHHPLFIDHNSIPENFDIKRYLNDDI